MGKGHKLLYFMTPFLFLFVYLSERKINQLLYEAEAY